MDASSNESSADRVGPPPDQKQLAEVIDLAERLSADGSELLGTWRENEYDIPYSELGDITRIRTIKLTKEGREKYPNLFLASIQVFRMNEDGERQTDYRISGEEGRFKADKFERDPRRPGEEWEDVPIDEFWQELDLISKEEDFEKKVGETFVDYAEIANVIDILTKLAVKEGKLPKQPDS